jgi:hypothetical protein
MGEKGRMQMHQFFDLKTPGDLLRKLQREYDRWEADELNVDLAWNFFVTAEHLPDWVHYQDMPTSGKTRPDLLDGEDHYAFKMDLSRPVLRICSHLANGAKHFHLKNSKLSSVASTRLQGGWIPLGLVPPGLFPLPALMVDLTLAEQQALSSAEASIKALTLAAKVLAFWQARLP